MFSFVQNGIGSLQWRPKRRQPRPALTSQVARSGPPISNSSFSPRASEFSSTRPGVVPRAGIFPDSARLFSSLVIRGVQVGPKIPAGAPELKHPPGPARARAGHDPRARAGGRLLDVLAGVV